MSYGNPRRRVVFVCADRRECEQWVTKWSRVQPARLPVHWSRRGEWRGIPMIAIANGAGASPAYAAAKVISHPAEIWNIGFGGAADPALSIGDIVAATCVRGASGAYPCAQLRFQPGASALFHSAVVQTSGAVVQTAREKSNYYAGGASVIEMEAEGIARAAGEAGVPFHCVRAISDLAGEDFENDFNAALLPDGRFSAARLIAGAFRDPLRRFAELIRLQKRTAIAARNLGEFLAHCEF